MTQSKLLDSSFVNLHKKIYIYFKDIALIHGRDEEYVKRQFRTAVIKQWSKDEFTLGAFALFPAYQVQTINFNIQNHKTVQNYQDQLILAFWQAPSCGPSLKMYKKFHYMNSK